MIELCALASGSNGNCYYIGNEDEAVLVDVGISKRQVLDRMKRVGLSIKKVKAIFISHEHSDHIRGVRVLAKGLDIPVYVTEKTYNRCRSAIRPQKYVPLLPNSNNQIGAMQVFTFLKNHDAIEPCSFSIIIDGKTIGVFTDIGSPCDSLKQQMAQCHSVFLETNYDEQLLLDGDYPAFLKQRVTSDKGHLSNKQALDLVKEHAGIQLESIFLSHISEDNNRLELVLNEFKEIETVYTLLPTNRYAPTDIYKMLS